MIKRLALLLVLLLVPVVVKASQGNLVLPTTGTVSGLTMTTDTNAALAALGSCNSGATSPTNNVGGAPVAGQCWWDTSAALPVLRVYDGTSWVRQNVVDNSNHVALTSNGPIATTSGTNSYTLTTNYEPTALYDGATVCFRIGTTNTAATTLAPNGLTAHALRSSPSTDFPSGVLVAGSVYCATYRVSSSEWITQGYYTTTAAQQIPSGSEFMFSGFTAPSGFFIENGQAVNRTTYAALMNAITLQLTGTRTSTSAVVTSLSSTSDLSPGWKIEGTGIPSNTTILSIDSSTQITMSAAATSSTTGTLTFFPHGNGDGSTTFNVPDYRGRVPMGQDNMGTSAANTGQVTTTLTTTVSTTAATVTSATGLAIGMYINSTNTAQGTTIAAISGTNITLSQTATATSGVSARFSPIFDANGVGQTGGSLSHVQDLSELATHNHTASVSDPGHNHSYSRAGGTNNVAAGSGNNVADTSGGTTGNRSTGISVTTGNSGSSNPMAIAQPTKVTKFIIKQ